MAGASARLQHTSWASSLS